MKRFFLLYVMSFITMTISSQNISELYKKVNPSVVTIVTKSKTADPDRTSESIGSGVLISAKGEILTASHVVNDAEYIRVKFLSGEEIPAKVIRAAPVADLALIKLAWLPKELVVAKIGNSDNVSIGDQIIIVGAPYGLEHSLSVGYISGRESKKTRTSGFTINEFFQTDASINHGNSGGPMFNLKGEIIGISSYIITESGGFQGLGFAATSNVGIDLVIDGNMRWTGISGYLLNRKQAWLLNVPMDGGMLIESIVNFSPADLEGLKGGFETIIIDGEKLTIGGDIILSINGLVLTRSSMEKLQGINNELLKDFQQKKKFELQVLRGGFVEKITFEF